MTGLVRKATLLSVCGLLAASAAFASVPDPANSTFDRAKLNLVGHDGVGSADTFSPFLVHVEDLAGNPIQGSLVVVDFSACTDVQFCEDQLGNSTADCPTMTVRAATDVNGDVTFYIIGGALIDIGDPDGSPCDCVEIYADGVNIVEVADEPVNAGTFDLDNDSGIGGADLALWLSDFGGGANPPRADYDHDQADDCLTGGGVGGADLSLWLSAFGGGLSAESCNTTGAAKCTP
jgi:hypothetical protein